MRRLVVLVLALSALGVGGFATWKHFQVARLGPVLRGEGIFRGDMARKGVFDVSGVRQPAEPEYAQLSYGAGSRPISTSGGIVWERRFDRSFFSAPSIARGVLYLASYSQRVDALDASSGATLWEVECHGNLAGGALARNGEALVVDYGGSLIRIREKDTP